MNSRRWLALALFLSLVATASTAQPIDRARGVDPRPDYTNLDRFGPWDDRNYDLTLKDLALLAPDEHQLRVAVPAFFRVELRRRFPGTLTSGPLQYPHSALLVFMAKYDGLLIDNKFYSGATFDGERWTVDVTEPIATRTAQGTTEALNGDVQISTPAGGRETAIELSPVNPELAVASAVIWPIGTRQEMFFSTDGGSTWTPSGPLPQGGALGDPTIGWSSDGAFVYTASLAFDLSTLFVYRSSDNGATWGDFANEPGGDSRREVGVSGSDKEYLHVDHSPSSPYLDNVYMTWDNFNQGNEMKFARSSDFGNTWVMTGFGSAPAGVAGDLTTDAAGKIYYLYPAFGDRTIRLLTSTNGGMTFSSASVVANTNASFQFTVPSQATRGVLIYLSTDTDRSSGPFSGSVYASWTDQRPGGSAFIQVAVSRDGGGSWALVEPHSPDVSPDRYHQWLEVDDDGNVHVIYYDSQDDVSRASVHLYHSMSTDGGLSWTVQRLTSESSPGANDGFDFGDYNGMSITMNQLIAAYADNRDGGVDMWAAGTLLGEPSYQLGDTDPGNAGVVNSWTVDNGTPLGDHAVYFGPSRGATTVSQGACVNVTVDIGNARQVGSATADASGSATATRLVPASADGFKVFFQALDLTTCQMSNLTETDL